MHAHTQTGFLLPLLATNGSGHSPNVSDTVKVTEKQNIKLKQGKGNSVFLVILVQILVSNSSNKELIICFLVQPTAGFFLTSSFTRSVAEDTRSCCCGVQVCFHSYLSSAPGHLLWDLMQQHRHNEAVPPVRPGTLQLYI